MKKKLLYLGVVIIAFALSVLASMYGKKDNFRYHQHLEKKPATQCAQDIHSINEKFCTHLPIVSINTNNQTIPGEPMLNEDKNLIGYTTTDNGETTIVANVKIIDNEENNHMDDAASIESQIRLRIRGNTSRHFDKKSYKLNFIDKSGLDRNVEVMGMASHDEWALHGPFLDKTMIRNYLSMNISANIMNFTPNVRFCEVFLDGEYIGLYLMMETIDVGHNRINITEYTEGKRGYGYVLKLDREAEEGSLEAINQFSKYTLMTEYKRNFSIEYPKLSMLNYEINKDIERDISKFEKALYSYDFNDKRKGYSAYIDVDSFVDYYILMEFLCVSDMMSFSTYMYKDVNRKLTMGPLWDFNNALNNFINIDFDGKDMYFTNRIWYKMLLKDKAFVDKVVNRYHTLRKTYLSEDYLLNYIDETVSYLGKAVDRNYQVWGYSFDYTKLDSFQRLRPYERNIKTYEESIEQMKNFIKIRGRWMDENIDTLYQYSHESKNRMFIQ